MSVGMKFYKFKSERGMLDIDRKLEYNERLY